MPNSTAISGGRTMPLGYMPQLDGFRALAVLCIWLEHWNITLKAGFRLVNWGHLAIWLFFVLSGFLITYILLKSKAEVEAGRRGPWEAAKVFYIRRCLRIWPIYFLTILALAPVLADVRRLLWWHLTYTTDFWATTHHGRFPVGVHFWTLAVEEQFYLFWPWVVILLPRKRLVPTLLTPITVAIAYRAAVSASGAEEVSAFALPMPIVGNLDKFALGGLLATFRADPGPLGQKGEHWLRAGGLFIALPLLVVFQLIYAWQGESRYCEPFHAASASVFFTWVIAGASRGFSGPLGLLLELRPVRFLGKISYGMFVYHMFIPSLLRRAHIPLPVGTWTLFLIYASTTVLVATASWYLIESPINDLKRYFKYTGRDSISAPANTSALNAPAPQ